MLQKLHIIFMSSNDSIISTFFVKINDHVGDSSNQTFEKNIHRMLHFFLLDMKIKKICSMFFSFVIKSTTFMKTTSFGA